MEDMRAALTTADNEIGGTCIRVSISPLSPCLVSMTRKVTGARKMITIRVSAVNHLNRWIRHPPFPLSHNHTALYSNFITSSSELQLLFKKNLTRMKRKTVFWFMQSTAGCHTDWLPFVREEKTPRREARADCLPRINVGAGLTPWHPSLQCPSLSFKSSQKSNNCQIPTETNPVFNIPKSFLWEWKKYLSVFLFCLV